MEIPSLAFRAAWSRPEICANVDLRLILQLKRGISEQLERDAAFEISKETGTIIQQVNYIDGLAWGKYYEWWPTGSKKVNGTYRFGLMYGRWKFYYKNGKMLCAGSYMNGKGHNSTAVSYTHLRAHET